MWRYVELEAFPRGKCCLDLLPVRRLMSMPGLPGKYVLSLCAVCLHPSHPYSALCPRFLCGHVPTCTRMRLVSGRGSAIIAGPLESPHNRHPHYLCPVALRLTCPFLGSALDCHRERMGLIRKAFFYMPVNSVLSVQQQCCCLHHG